MPTSHERLDAEIGLVLDYSPEALPVDHDSPCPRLMPPLSFYDKHLDERLSLKKITLVPSLTNNLSAAVERVFKTIRENHVILPPVERDFPTLAASKWLRDRDPVVDANAVGRAYQVVISTFATVLASMLSLHIHSPRWSTSIVFVTHPTTRYQRYYALNEDFAPELLTPYKEPEVFGMVQKEAWHSMNEAKQDELRQVQQRFPLLAVWQIFFVCCDAENALKHMDNIVSKDTFPHTAPLTQADGYPPAVIDLPPSPDATNTAWGIPMSSFIGGTVPSSTRGVGAAGPPVTVAAVPLADVDVPLRRSSRVREKINNKRPRTKGKKNVAPKTHCASTDTSCQWLSVTIPAKARATADAERMAKAILQHAWTRAVERDSSFIVMHCGNFERIALRHRASQTLFMSELIDVTRCIDPAYGEIHVGLYMAIIEDALDRTRQLVQREIEMSSGNQKKRKREVLQASESRKRPKTRASVAQEAARKAEYLRKFKAVSEEVSGRSLALIRIRHQHFNSPAPASFLRVNLPEPAGKSVYEPHEYFYLTITSKLAAGATGDTHAATIELLSTNGETYTLDKVVVKLAFERDQRKRMRHEFEVYEHLKSSGVTGIPHIFGLLEDVESDTLALVMNNVGTCLWDRRPDKEKAAFPVTKSERDAFAEVLKGIHDAGVRHRDIRAENLVVSDESAVSIIDFDRADMQASERSRQRELQHLLSLLDGDYSTVGDLPSYGTRGRRYSFESNSENSEKGSDEDHSNES